MPIITERQRVLDVYAAAAERQWTIPCFCSENQTSTEAVLTAVAEHGRRRGVAALPIILAITNLYGHRSQTVHYTHTRRWDIGLKLFLNDIKVLAGRGGPFSKLKVLVHLDHIQHDADRELWSGDLKAFSSIMFDASALPFEQNMEATARFVEQRGREIVVEGACDEIVDAGGASHNALTTPEKAETYFRRTGVDSVVPNLGTEHRAGAATLHYHGEVARRIRERIGTKLVLHGCSSVPRGQIGRLFADGVCKVNLWTCLERDSAPALFADMVRHAAPIAGSHLAGLLQHQGLLGPHADVTGTPQLSHFTTTYRQDLIFREMQKIVTHYLELWLT